MISTKVVGARRGALLGEVNAFAMFALFAAVELGHGPVVTHDTGPDFAACALLVPELNW